MKIVVAAIGLQAYFAVALLTAQHPPPQQAQQQTIAFDTIAAQVAGGSVTLSAKATSGLPVSYTSSTPAVCTVLGATATLVKTGTCTIQASQTGNAQYGAATVSQSFAIAPQPSPAAKTKSVSSGSQTTQYNSIANGGKLPYGKSVTLTGQTSDLKCGNQSISGVIDISGIAASYLGQTSTPSTGTITGTTWTAPLGSLPADATVNLQLKVNGKLSDATAAEVTNELLADSRFLGAVNGFFAATKEATTDASKPPSPITSAMATQEAQMVLDSISAKNGTLTQILGHLLPSCAVVTDVTTAAMIGLRANETALLNFQARIGDLRKPGVQVTGLDPNASAADAYKLVKALNPTDAATLKAVKIYERDYEDILGAFKVDVIAQLSQGVELTQVTDTADLNKYAGFDVGAIYAPRINELRQFDMVHIYPFGPVELDTSGGVPMKARWSIALGVSVGDLSSNGKSRIKGDKAFVYGVGFRINKYFRVSAGGMVYRDAIGNGLLNEFFIGPSIDVTALPGLKQVFASSSGTGGNASSKSNAASKPAGSTSAPNPADNSTNQ